MSDRNFSKLSARVSDCNLCKLLTRASQRKVSYLLAQASNHTGSKLIVRATDQNAYIIPARERQNMAISIQYCDDQTVTSLNYSYIRHEYRNLFSTLNVCNNCNCERTVTYCPQPTPVFLLCCVTRTCCTVTTGGLSTRSR